MNTNEPTSVGPEDGSRRAVVRSAVVAALAGFALGAAAFQVLDTLSGPNTAQPIAVASPLPDRPAPSPAAPIGETPPPPTEGVVPPEHDQDLLRYAPHGG